MSLPFTIRHTIHPSANKTLTTQEQRDNFLIEDVFIDNTITCTYSFYDRYITGGAKPLAKPLSLDTPDILKADFFLQRREIGIINVGDTGTVIADDQKFILKNKEALYLGKGV